MNDLRLWSRRIAKTVVARTLGRFLPSHPALVLGYHRVVERYDEEARVSLPGSLVSRAMLERQLDTIGRRYEFVTLDELAEGINGRRKPMAAVTFDDGYEDVYYNALPLLMRKGIPAAVFVVTDLVGSRRGHAHDLLYSCLRQLWPIWASPRSMLLSRLIDSGIDERRSTAIVRRPPAPVPITRALLTMLSKGQLERLLGRLRQDVRMSGGGAPASPAVRSVNWEMVSAMHHAGITIGSHTRTHALLPNETRERVWEEVASSRRELERRIGEPIMHFAFPDGRFNAASLRAVSAAGYRHAYTTCPHRDLAHPELTIQRRVLWEHSAVDASGRFSPEILQCQANGWLTGRGGCTWQSHA